MTRLTIVLAILICIIGILELFRFYQPEQSQDNLRSFVLGYWEADPRWTIEADAGEFSVMINPDMITVYVGDEDSIQVSESYVVNSCRVLSSNMLSFNISSDENRCGWDGSVIMEVSVSDGTAQLYRHCNGDQVLLARLCKDNQLSNVLKYE